MAARIDLQGNKFGRLLVIEFGGTNKAKRAIWKCRCDCGRSVNVVSSDLRNGDTKSCGCLKREVSAQMCRDNPRPKHGGHKTRIYGIWESMRARCLNPNNDNYPNYGARGISVCQEWNDFSNFRDWAQKHGYARHLTIERKDNDKGYSPGNCRWATRQEQSENTRRTRLLVYDGRSQTAKAWAKEAGIHYNTFLTRINSGWPIELAMTVLPSYRNAWVTRSKKGPHV